MDINLVRIILDEAYEDLITLPELVSVAKVYFQGKGVIDSNEVISMLAKEVEGLIDRDIVRLYRNRDRIDTKYRQKLILENFINWVKTDDPIEEFTIDLTDTGLEEWKKLVFPPS